MSAYRGQFRPIRRLKGQAVPRSVANKRRLRQHTRPDPLGTNRPEPCGGTDPGSQIKSSPAAAVSQNMNIHGSYLLLREHNQPSFPAAVLLGLPQFLLKSQFPQATQVATEHNRRTNAGPFLEHMGLHNQETLT
ncbi:uncharacterized protein LOC144582162 [Callithrix jacchus]